MTSNLSVLTRQSLFLFGESASAADLAVWAATQRHNLSSVANSNIQVGMGVHHYSPPPRIYIHSAAYIAEMECGCGELGWSQWVDFFAEGA